MQTTTERPLPTPTAETAPFWKAASEGRLEIQRCGDCGRWQHYPRRFCTACLSENVAFAPVSGRGAIYAFTICRIPGHPAMKDRTPYAMAMVDLDVGVRMLAGVEGDLDAIRAGAEVEVFFEPLAEEIGLPMFRLVSSERADA